MRNAYRPIPLAAVTVFCIFLLVDAASATAGDTESVKDVAALSAQAATRFRQNDVKGALEAVDAASVKTRRLAPGQERAIAGYEIKDAVFSALENGSLSEAELRNRAVRLALQSLSAENSILPDASLAECINDASFLYRISQWHRGKGNIGESVNTLLLVLCFDKKLDVSQRPYEPYDIAQYGDWLIDENRFAEMIRVLQANRSDADVTVGLNRLTAKLYEKKAVNVARRKTMKGAPVPAPAEDTSDSATVLRRADDAARLMQLIVEEFSRRSTRPTFAAWHISVHQYIWTSYYAAGSPQEAQQKLEAWITAIRKLDERILRSRKLIEAAQTVYWTAQDKGASISLLNEAEEVAEQIDEPRYKKDAQESIARFRSSLK